jgi:hypothetical protein
MKSIFLSLFTFLIILAVISFHAFTTESIYWPLGKNSNKSYYAPISSEADIFSSCAIEYQLTDETISALVKNLINGLNPPVFKLNEPYEILKDGAIQTKNQSNIIP